MPARHAKRGVGPDVHDALLARGRQLELATIGWNSVEVFVTIGLGLAAGSLALIAFGLDSLVEIFASAVVLWYIGNHHAERRAKHALRLVAVAFAILGIYLAVASVYNLNRVMLPGVHHSASRILRWQRRQCSRWRSRNGPSPGPRTANRSPPRHT
jgi:hypothetical protein